MTVRPSRRNLLALCMAAAAGCTGTAQAQQAFPSRPIKLVVPYPAGGTTDILARRICASMAATLQQPVVVENRPGAATIIGAEAVKNAPADGHTLLVAGSTWGTNTLLYRKLPYRLDDFVPLTSLIKAPYALVVSPSSPPTLARFIEQAKAQAGKQNYATIGTGGSSHLLAERLKKLAGIDLAEVPYKGAAPALLAVAANEVQMYFDAITTSLPQHRAGKLRILAVTSDERLPVAPEVPTFKESGFPAMTVYFWFGVLAPRGTPQPVLGTLHAAISQAVQAEDFRARMATDGAIAQAMAPGDFSAFIRNDIGTWGDMIKPLNLPPLD